MQMRMNIATADPPIDGLIHVRLVHRESEDSWLAKASEIRIGYVQHASPVLAALVSSIFPKLKIFNLAVNRCPHVLRIASD